MAAVIAGIEKVASQAGYNLIISQSLESVKKEMANVDTMFNSRVDGLLVSLAGDTEDIDHFNFLLNKGMPLIFFDRVYQGPNCTSIVIDNCKAGYDITNHLLEQGCRRIVHIAGNLHANVYAERLKGYQQALSDHGVAFDENLLIICNLSDQAGVEAAQRILDMHPLPDGIFAANDTSAVACMAALEEKGIKIPEEIAIAGFNNDPISRVIHPNLTTIHYPGQEMGEVAAATLISSLNAFPNASLNTTVLRHELIIRQSSIKKSQ
jgi:LacI family transcriptional regulator